jgi:hypothetical protein
MKEGALFFVILKEQSMQFAVKREYNEGNGKQNF